MSGQLSDLLQHVLNGEPEIGDEVDAVFRHAEKLRRRRLRLLAAAGAGVAASIVGVGYVLTTALLPAPPIAPVVPVGTPVAVASAGTPSATPAPAPSATAGDRVRAVIEPLVKGRDLVVRSPERGDGWRRYAVADADGRPRGMIEVAVYDVPGELCFPVRADRKACARADRAGDLEFVRYDDDSDADRQVRQTIARRLGDGRTVVVMAAGRRDAGAEAGRPGLTGAQVEQVATDERVFEAFAGDEGCDGASADDCPAFRVRVPE